MFGFVPSNIEFMKLIRDNAIVGTKVCVKDVLAANDLFGDDIAELRGKSRRQTPLRVEFHQGIKSVFPTQTLCIDLAYISRNECFLISVSKPLGLVMVNWMGPEKLSKSALKCQEAIENQVKDYAARNFIVNVIRFDGERNLGATAEHFVQLGITVQITSPGQHVAEVERKIQTVKNTMRTILAHLELDYGYKLPSRFYSNLVRYAAAKVNLVTTKGGVEGISPFEGFTGSKITMTRLRTEFGAFYEVYIPNSIAVNSMSPRTQAGIALDHPYNQQGVNFYLFTSNRILSRTQFVKLTIPLYITKLLNDMYIKGEGTQPDVSTPIGSKSAGAEVFEESDQLLQPTSTHPIEVDTVEDMETDSASQGNPESDNEQESSGTDWRSQVLTSNTEINENDATFTELSNSSTGAGASEFQTTETEIGSGDPEISQVRAQMGPVPPEISQVRAQRTINKPQRYLFFMNSETILHESVSYNVMLEDVLSTQWDGNKGAIKSIVSEFKSLISMHVFDVLKWCNQTGKMAVELYIDASFAVHSDLKSQTGAIVVVGGTTVEAKSVKQKTIGKSSTESEINALSDMAGLGIWTSNFIAEFDIECELTIYEDNMAVIALIETGRPVSDRSKHLSIRSFWLTEQIENNILRLTHLSTDLMLADMLTKPLQGATFLRLRDQLLGVSTASNTR